LDRSWEEGSKVVKASEEFGICFALIGNRGQVRFMKENDPAWAGSSMQVLRYHNQCPLPAKKAMTRGKPEKQFKRLLSQLFFSDNIHL
jgi:hypothetical protein